MSRLFRSSRNEKGGEKEKSGDKGSIFRLGMFRQSSPSTNDLPTTPSPQTGPASLPSLSHVTGQAPTATLGANHASAYPEVLDSQAKPNPTNPPTQPTATTQKINPDESQNQSNTATIPAHATSGHTENSDPPVLVLQGVGPVQAQGSVAHVDHPSATEKPGATSGVMTLGFSAPSTHNQDPHLNDPNSQSDPIYDDVPSVELAVSTVGQQSSWVQNNPSYPDQGPLEFRGLEYATDDLPNQKMANHPHANPGPPEATDIEHVDDTDAENDQRSRRVKSNDQLSSSDPLSPTDQPKAAVQTSPAGLPIHQVPTSQKGSQNKSRRSSATPRTKLTRDSNKADGNPATTAGTANKPVVHHTSGNEKSRAASRLMKRLTSAFSGSNSDNPSPHLNHSSDDASSEPAFSTSGPGQSQSQPDRAPDSLSHTDPGPLELSGVGYRDTADALSTVDDQPPLHSHTDAGPLAPGDMRYRDAINARWAAKHSHTDTGDRGATDTEDAQPSWHQFVLEEDIKPSADDILIAVMGPTGAGKSSFISIATKQKGGEVGHSLRSQTATINPIKGTYSIAGTKYARRVIFVDTPGFDDTSRTDTEILEMIADWLQETYADEIKLAGVLYLHPISDNRMSGTSLKNLRMFEKLCGKGALKKVVLLTTMWDDVDEDQGAPREKELQATFWKSMIKRGSTVARFGYNIDSAWNVVGELLDQTAEQRRALRLQKELVDQNKELSETNAGAALLSTLEKLLAQQKRALSQLQKEAGSEAGSPSAAILKQECEDLNRRIESTLSEMDKLHIPIGERLLNSLKSIKNLDLGAWARW